MEEGGGGYLVRGEVDAAMGALFTSMGVSHSGAKGGKWSVRKNDG